MQKESWALGAVYLIWGSTYAAIAIAIESLPPFLMAGVRWTLAGAMLYVILRARGVATPSSAQWRQGWIAGALLFVGGNGLVCWAEQRVSSGTAAMALATVPLFTVVIGWLVYRERRPDRWTWIGLAFGVVGVGALFGSADQTDVAGAIAVLVAALCWAFGTLYVRHSTTPSSVFMASATHMLAGGAMMLAVGVLRGEVPSNPSLEALGALAYLVAFGSLAGFGAYAWLIKRISSDALSTHAFVNPMVAVALGWLILDEAVTGHTLLASAAIVAAVALILRRRAPA